MISPVDIGTAGDKFPRSWKILAIRRPAKVLGQPHHFRIAAWHVPRCCRGVLESPAHPDVRDDRSWLNFTTTSDVVFALRTTVAGIAALFTAMWLQLDVPRWAMWTVFIVSPPVRGNALRKTTARLVGTLIGCVAAVAIVGAFPQDRVGFYVIFAAWLGSCAYWATLRRGYVSYAAILAAFTSAIIAADVASTLR